MQSDLLAQNPARPLPVKTSASVTEPICKVVVRSGAALAALAVAFLLAACSGDDDDGALPSVAALTSTCASMAGRSVDNVLVTTAVRIEANATLQSAGFCKVTATRAPYLDIEVDLPDNWSGRLWHQGGGGLDGSVVSAVTSAPTGVITALDPALALKAAVYVSSNGGNRASVAAQAAPGVWVNGTADGKASGEDYAYKGLLTTQAFAKALTTTF